MMQGRQRYGRKADARARRPKQRARRITEAEALEVRAAEQAEIRRTFVADAGVPPKRAQKVPAGRGFEPESRYREPWERVFEGEEPDRR